MVLVITTIIASLATMMLMQQRHQINSTQSWIMQQRMRRSASFCMPWAVTQLQKQTFHAPVYMPSMLKNGIHMDATLSDAADRFNLNQLNDTHAQEQLAKFLQQLEPTLSPTKALALSKQIATHAPKQQDQAPYWLSNTQLRELPFLDPALEKKLEPHTIALTSDTPSSASPTSTGSHIARLQIDLRSDAMHLVIVKYLYHDAHQVYLWRQYDSIETP